MAARDRFGAAVAKAKPGAGAGPGVLERKFMRGLEESDALVRLCGFLGRSLEDSRSLVDELCKCCWPVASKVLTSDGPVAAAKAEAERLKKRLTEIQLSTMKELMHLRNQGPSIDEEDEDIKVTFYEPMKFLDEETRELVMMIVDEKVRKIKMGQAGKAFLRALTRRRGQAAAAAAGGAARAGGPEADEDTDGEDGGDAKASQAAGTKSAVAPSESRSGSAAVEALQKEKEELGQKLQEALERAEVATQRAEEARGGLAAAAAEAATQRAKEASGELAAAAAEEPPPPGRAAAAAAAALSCERGSQTEAPRPAPGASSSTQEAGRAPAASSGGGAGSGTTTLLHGAERLVGCTKGTQTSLTGEQMEVQSKEASQQASEGRRWKVVLDELQGKFRELTSESHAEGIGPQVERVLDKIGVGELLSNKKKETVFDRLYGDAVRRRPHLAGKAELAGVADALGRPEQGGGGAEQPAGRVELPLAGAADLSQWNLLDVRAVNARGLQPAAQAKPTSCQPLQRDEPLPPPLQQLQFRPGAIRRVPAPDAPAPRGYRGDPKGSLMPRISSTPAINRSSILLRL